MSIEFCAGADVGGTKVSSALFDAEGRTYDRAKVALDRSGNTVAAAQLVRIIQELEAAARARDGSLLAVGICIPGIAYQDTGLVWAPNIPGWDHFDLGAVLRRTVRLPLVVDSDRSAYVLGEQWRGVAQGMRDVVFLAVGTGIGAGILTGGRLCRGAEDIAGAVGWFGLNPDYKKEYEAMGCFEAEASGSSLGRKARRAAEAGVATEIRRLAGGEVERITAETVIAAARLRDALAVQLVEETARYLAMGIANIISILNPQMVVLGGGLFQAGDILIAPVRREFGKWAQPLAARNVRVEPSSLGEDAGLVGAGRLAWESLKGGGSCLR